MGIVQVTAKENMKAIRKSEIKRARQRRSLLSDKKIDASRHQRRRRNARCARWRRCQANAKMRAKLNAEATAKTKVKGRLTIQVKAKVKDKVNRGPDNSQC